MPTSITYSTNAHKAKRDELTRDERDILTTLEQDLRETAGKPYGRGWQHLGPVKQYHPDAMHCHFTRKKVALWVIKATVKNKTKQVTCRFEFVGLRGQAPY